MTELLLSLIFFAWLPDCFSQQTPQRGKYKTIVTTTVRTKTKGILLEAGDSSLLIYSRSFHMRIPASTIKQIKIKRRKAAGRGALVGGLIGLGVGAIAGYASGDDEPCQPGNWFCDQVTAEEKALGLGLAMSMGGAIVGSVVGSFIHEEKFVINGELNSYANKLNDYKRYIPASPVIP